MDYRNLDDLRSPEELSAYQGEVRARMIELDTEYQGLPFPTEEREEYASCDEQDKEIAARLVEIEARTARVTALSKKPEHVESSETFQTRRTGVARDKDIWDLSTVRSSITDPGQVVTELHERSKRAIELSVFPDERVNQEAAQTHVERLLAKDNRQGELAQLILSTGSPTYRRAFGKYCSSGFEGLSTEERRAMSQAKERAFTLGATGFPVVFTLDPTVIPVSNSVVNPLRAISSVDQIVGTNEWRGLTAAAITAARASEAAEVTDNTPTLAQPAIVCSKVHAFVPFSIESGQDWGGMDATLGRLFADAKDDEEATAFMSGNGTPPNPFGITTGVTGTTSASTGLTITAANLYALEAALAPRFRPRAQWIANRAMYNIIRALDTAGGAALWRYIGEGLTNAPRSDGGNGNIGAELLGHPANELSTMQATVVNATKIMILGDFSMFKIIDRVGMSVELIPHLFDVGNNRPSGSRGLYAYWRNGSKVIDAVGFRALTGTT